MPSANKNVLIVDDEAMIAEAIASDLNTQGYHTFLASGGHQAWEIFQANAIDLVITDVRMPLGDGVELLKRIRALDPKVPAILFVTGYKDISDEDALKLGVSGILEKPFTRQLLRKAIDGCQAKQQRVL